MKQYFMNLLGALIGRSPYPSELDEMQCSLKKAWSELDDMVGKYNNALDLWEKSESLVREYERKVDELEGKVAEYERKVADNERRAKAMSERKPLSSRRKLKQ